MSAFCYLKIHLPVIYHRRKEARIERCCLTSPFHELNLAVGRGAFRHRSRCMMLLRRAILLLFYTTDMKRAYIATSLDGTRHKNYKGDYFWSLISGEDNGWTGTTLMR